MKEKSTDKFKAINKNATVGNRVNVVMVIDPPVPKKSSVSKASVSVKASSKKKKKCSGCSRKRRSA